MVLQIWSESSTFILVFHRILDFKTGLNVYSDPFFYALNFRPPLNLPRPPDPDFSKGLFSSPVQEAGFSKLLTGPGDPGKKIGPDRNRSLHTY